MIGIKNTLVSAVQRVCGHSSDHQGDRLPETQETDFFSKFISFFKPFIQELISFFQIFWTTFKKGSIVSFMYTFSFMVVSIGIIINRQSVNEAESAAVAPISTILNLFFGLFLSALFAISLLVSGYLGEIKKLEHPDAEELPQIGASEETETVQTVGPSKEEFQLKVGNIFRHGLRLSLVLTPFLMAPLLFAEPLLLFLKQSIDVAKDVGKFTEIFAWAAFPMFIRVNSEQIGVSNDCATPMMCIALFDLAWGTALAIGLGRIMGITGIAIACTAQTFADAFFDLVYLYKSKAFKDFKLFDFRQEVRGSSKALWEMLSLGVGMSFSTFNQMFTTFVTSLEAGLLPPPAQSIWGAILTVLFFFFIPTAAFGAICAQKVSHEIGANDYRQANRMAKYSLLTLLFCIALPSIGLGLYPQILTFLLGLDETVSAGIKQILPIMLLAITSDALRYNLFQQLRALKYKKFSTSVSFLGMLLSIVTTGLGFETGNINNVAWGYTVGSLAQLVALLSVWLPEIRPHRIQEIKENAMPSGCLAALFSSSGRNFEDRRNISQSPVASFNSILP